MKAVYLATYEIVDGEYAGKYFSYTKETDKIVGGMRLFDLYLGYAKNYVELESFESSEAALLKIRSGDFFIDSPLMTECTQLFNKEL